MEAVTVILLAAGYATRLYPLTKDKPKALLPLGEGVILDTLVSQLAPLKAMTTLVSNHRFAEQFQAWQRQRQAPVTILDDGTETPESRLGAIRDLELARTRRGGTRGDALVIGTDNVFTWPLAEFVAQARAHAPHASVALWQAPSAAMATQFGVVRRDPDGRITEFSEKSPQPVSNDVALCVYWFPETMHHRFAEFLASGGNADAPGYFIKWLSEQEPVYGLMMPGAWYDIGTIETYQELLREWRRTA